MSRTLPAIKNRDENDMPDKENGMCQVQVSNNMVHLRNYKKTWLLLLESRWLYPQLSFPSTFIGHFRVGPMS